MNNYTFSSRNNQAFSKQYISLLYWMGGSLVGYHNYKPSAILHTFTSTRKKILEVILRYSGIYHEVYISQDRIAQLSDCHHDTVLKNIKLFVELGVLKKKYRGANRTCVYSITPFFRHERVMYALRDIFPNLYWSVQSTIRRCKGMLSGLLASVMKPITARLSNDKNKDINTVKKSIKNNHKEEKIERKTTMTYERGPDHDRLVKEFSLILGIG